MNRRVVGVLAAVLATAASILGPAATAGAGTRPPPSVATGGSSTSVAPGAPGAPVPTTGAPSGDAFYLPPVPLPQKKAGALIRAEPITAPAGARAWRVLAHSDGLAGRSVAVSGVVVAPAEPAARAGSRPVVTWAHGTVGLGDPCAPSKRDDAVARLPWLADLLDAGYVVAATDYHGLGTPGVHPYLVGESEGRAVLDFARVARRLPTGAGKDVLVVGHSQGGHAALFAGELARTYAPELRVRGIAAGAPVADPGAFLERTAVPPLTGFVVMGAVGYEAAYPELALTDVLTPSAATAAELATFGCAGQVLAAFATADPATVFRDDLRSRPDWARRLRENTAGTRAAAGPVLVWQGTADELVPAALSEAYVTRACAARSTVEYRAYPGADHASVLGAVREDLLAFLAARLGPTPAVSSCAPRTVR